MIRIITDSTSEITPEEAKKNNIDVVPLYVIFNGKTYKDRVDLDIDGFYEHLKKFSPTTSQPSPGDFLEIFDKYAEDEIICLTCSQRLSGTYQSANLAKAQSKNQKVHVINSETISLGLRGIVFETVGMRDKNFSCEEIIEGIKFLKNKSITMGGAQTLEYLKRGGRISNIAAIAGSFLNIKPILTVNDGLVKSYKKKARGKNNAISIVSQAVDEFNIDKSLPVIIGYSRDLENAEALMEKLKGKGIKIAEVCEIGPVIGTHTGPGAFILSFFGKK